MLSNQPSDNEVVEVDGIRFETVMPKRVIVIPPNLPDTKTEVELGIRIINNSSVSQRFLLFVVHPDFYDQNGQKLTLIRQAAYRSDPAVLTDFKLLAPGEDVTFLVEAWLQWFEDELKFVVFRKDSSYWWVGNFQPGTYSIQVVYENPYPNWEQKNIGSNYFAPSWKNEMADNQLCQLVKIKNVWIGPVSTPLINFSLTGK